MLKWLPILPLLAACLPAQTMPPAPEKELARSIYKELVEIKSGYHHRRDYARG